MFRMIAQWLNSQTIAQNGEIQKQLNNTPNRNYKNYRSCYFLDVIASLATWHDCQSLTQ